MIFYQTIVHGASLDAKRYISCELSLDVNSGNYEGSSV